MTTCIISQEVHKIKSFSVFDRCFRVLVIWEVSVYHTSIMKTSEDLRVFFFSRPFGHLFRCMLSKKPLLIDVRFLPIITITNYIMFIAISSSSEYEGASIWNMQKKIFGRHKAQNLKQSNLLLVQKIYPYITSRKTAFRCKSFWWHILYWFFKVILLS